MGFLRIALAIAAVLAAAALAVVLPAASRASGCTITWDGGASGSWTTATNWTDDRLPNASDHTCIGGGAAVTLSSPVTIDHFGVASGASLTITGVRLRAVADSTNAGTITLAGNGAALSVENGVAANAETLTNTGAIVSTGSGGEQEIAGDLANQGTLTVGHEALKLRTFADVRAPKLINAGQLTASAGGGLLVAGTLVLPPSGTVSGPGTVDVDTGGRLEIAGGTIAANADLNAVGGSGNCCGNAPGAQIAFVGAGTSTGRIGVSSAIGGRHALIGDVPAGITLDLEATGIVIAGADWTNAGTIQLQTSTSELYSENGVNTDSETLTNTGTILTAGKLGGDLVNSGTLSARSPDASFVRADGNRQSKLTNTGALAATAGNRLVFPATTLSLGAGGTASGPGLIDVETSGRLEVAGGTIAANADLNAIGGSGNCCGNAPGAQLAFVGASAATGTIGVSSALGGRHALSGNVPAGITLELETSGVLAATADWTNAGTIRLSGSNTAVFTENGVNTDVETLTNTGTIITTGAGDARTLSGNLFNSGTISVRHPATVFPRADGNRQAELTNSGALGATAGNRLALPGTTLRLNSGGTVTGPGTIDVDTGGRLEVAGGTIDPSADLNAAGGTGNCCGNAPGAQLALLSPDLTGEIGVTTSLGGTHALTGDIPAGLTLDVSSRLVGSGALTNAGTVRFTSGGFLGVPPADTLTNLGTIAGGGALGGHVRNDGELDGMPITGSFTQTPGGRLLVTASNNAVSTLQVSGTATLDGELAIETESPPPDPNVDRVAVGAASRRGTFTNVAGRATGPWAVLYTPSGVVLRGVAPAEFVGGPELTLDDASVTEGASGTANMTFTARLGQAPGHPVAVEWHTVDDSATSPSDFTESSGIVGFNANETTKTFTVPVKGDTDVEPAETFLVRLRGARGAGLGVARATGLIIADDLGITGATPDRAGQGTATVTVRGGGFAPGTTAKLSRPGAEDVPGTVLFTDAGRSRMEVRFDLTEAAVGPWDLVVSAGPVSATRLAAVTVEPRRRPRLEVSVSAPEILRFGFTGRATVSVHNAGNVDADVELIRLTAGNLRLSLPGDAGFTDPPFEIDGARLAGLLGGAAAVPGGATRQFGVRFQSTSSTAHAPLTINAEVIDSDFLDAALTGELPPGVDGHIVGRLQTPAGAPVGGVQVGAVTPRGVRGDSATDVTGSDGSFDLGPLGDAAYLVAAGGDPTVSPDAKTVTINAADRAPTITLTKAVSRVAGSVRRPDGTRVTDARVSLLSGTDRLATVRADGAGAFSFAVVRSGSYRLRAISATSGIATGDVPVTAGTAATGLTLTTGGRALAVTVAGPGGPVEGAVVSAREPGSAAGPERRTGANGVATFAGLPPGTLTVEAAAVDLAPSGAEVAAGATSATLTLGAGARIEGDLTRAGAPVFAAAAIAVERGSGREHRGFSAPDGHYAITSLAAGTYDVWLAGPGLVPQLMPGVVVAAGATQTLDAVLQPGGSTQELSLEAPDGSRSRGAQFTVRHVGTGVRLLTAFSGGNGVARVGPLPAGQFEVEAGLPGGAPIVAPLTVARGTAAREPLSLGRWQQQQIPQPGFKGNTREAYYFENPPQTNWFDGTTEPVPQPYDTSNGYLEYLQIEYRPPCDTFKRITRLLDVKRHVLNDLFQNYHRAWVEMDAANDQDMANYLFASAKLTADVMTLGRLSMATDAVERAGDFGGALTGQLQGLGELAANSAIKGELPSSQDLAEQAQTALETLRQRADPSDLRKFGDGTQGIAAANALRDLSKLITEVDEFPDKVRQRGDAFRDAQAKYLNAIVAMKQMTVELQRLHDEDCPEDPNHPKPPRRPSPGPSGSWTGDLRLSGDPNDILGPVGVGAERWIGADQALAYMIRFENQPTATASAVQVVVETQLDADVELDAFTLGDLGWGDVTIQVPPGLQSFHDDVPQAGGDVVRVDAELDRATRTVRWELSSIDPVTGELEESAAAGFLPPEDGSHRGQGFLTYDVRATDAVAHGAQIDAKARIVFDRNAPIDTPLHRNTVDDVAPVSAVTAVTQVAAARCTDDLAVTWAGGDTGSGIGTYDIWVSRDGASFTPWLTGTAATTGTYPGASGHRYAFASVARDKVGRLEPVFTGADQERVAACDRAAPTTLMSAVGGTPVNGFYPGPVDVSIEGIDTPGGSGVDQVVWSATGASPGGATVTADTTLVPLRSDGETKVEARTRDAAGNETAPSTVTVKIDSKPPVVTIVSPAEGAKVVSGSKAVADFACADAGAGLASCEGSIADGARIDQGAQGARTLTITAVDKVGKETKVTRSFRVVGRGLSAKPVALRLGKPNRKGVAKLKVTNREQTPIVAVTRVIAARKAKALTKSVRVKLAARKAKTVKVRFKKPVRKGSKRKARVEAVVTGPAGDKRTLRLKVTVKGWDPKAKKT